ncbi:PREDICTED: uncharacterized protein LOC106821025, partial [Priapulus caudatus]|uniref:Uncharacterized protein LOC106821025 n=1 Tax=Priapulus caudatus TaxID=37621 RepID=A0ABM1F9M6_PRICU
MGDNAEMRGMAESSSWKRCRQYVVRCVDDLLQEFAPQSNEGDKEGLQIGVSIRVDQSKEVDGIASVDIDVNTAVVQGGDVGISIGADQGEEVVISMGADQNGDVRIDEAVWDAFARSIDLASLRRDVQWEAEHPRPLLVVVDDNMYYRGMRREYRRVARRHAAGFCVVHVACDLTDALYR